MPLSGSLAMGFLPPAPADIFAATKRTGVQNLEARLNAHPNYRDPASD